MLVEYLFNTVTYLYVNFFDSVVAPVVQKTPVSTPDEQVETATNNYLPTTPTATPTPATPAATPVSATQTTTPAATTPGTPAPGSIEASLLADQPPGTIIKCVTAQVIQTTQGPRIVLTGLQGADFTPQQLSMVQQQVKQQLLKGSLVVFPNIKV